MKKKEGRDEMKPVYLKKKKKKKTTSILVICIVFAWRALRGGTTVMTPRPIKSTENL